MVLLELALFIIGFVTVVSAIDFIAKTTSNITNTIGLPEYLTSTIVISFVIALPVLLIMIISNFYDIPSLGLSTALGFAMTVITLVMGIFLFKNELPVTYEGYRNSTFMWASALVLLIVSFDRYIDRMDAIFLLLLFAFYVVYIAFRTGKAKEYVYLKKIEFNRIIYPLSIVSILISSWFLVMSASILGAAFGWPLVIIGGVLLGLLIALPLFDVIPSIFRSSRLTFDNLLGNIVICLTLVPGIAALINPIPLSLGGDMSIMPFIGLNIITLSFAMSTRFTRSLHKKTGIVLIAAYAAYVLYLIFV